MYKILFAVLAFSFCWAADDSAIQDRQSSSNSLFLKATQDIAKHQLLFRTDSDGIFASPDDFGKFFESVLADQLKFNQDNPPQPEDFRRLIDNIKIFNHLWTFLIRNAPEHSQAFLNKIQQNDRISDKEAVLNAAQKNIVETYYYCSAWLPKIANLYRHQIVLVKLISSGINAQRMLKEHDFSKTYYTDGSVTQILRELSALANVSENRRSPRKTIVIKNDFDVPAFITQTLDNSNASLVYDVNADGDFTDMSDYETFFKGLLSNLDKIDASSAQRLNVLGKILTYILHQTNINAKEYLISASVKGDTVYKAAKTRVGKVFGYLTLWLPELVKLYNLEYDRLSKVNLSEGSAQKLNQRIQFSDAEINSLLEELKKDSEL